MKILLLLLIFFNLFLATIYTFNYENILFKDIQEKMNNQKDQIKEINKAIKKNEYIKNIDIELYNYYKTKETSKKIREECKKTIRESFPSNGSLSISFNYVDYKKRDLKDIINCNIYKAYDINNITIKIPFNFIKYGLFKDSILNKYRTKGYKINYFITLRKKDLISTYDIFRKINKKQTNSIVFYINEELDEYERKNLKRIFTYYYENYDIPVYIGSKNKTYNNYKVYYKKEYEDDLLSNISKDIKNTDIIGEYIYLDYNLSDAKKINFFELTDLIEGKKVKINIPNSFYYTNENIDKEENLKSFIKLREEALKKISSSEFELMNLKYEKYFSEKEDNKYN